MIIPWSVEDSRVIHADKWINVRAERVKTAKGVILDPYYVVSYADWTCVVALTPDEQVVLVRQYRHGTGQTYLELPSGRLDPEDTSPVDGAVRELLEETGYGAGEISYLGAFPPNPAQQSNHMHMVLMCNAVKLQEQTLDEGEELQVELMPFSEAIRATMDGRISQPMHISALYIARETLRHSVP